MILWGRHFFPFFPLCLTAPERDQIACTRPPPVPGCEIFRHDGRNPGVMIVAVLRVARVKEDTERLAQHNRCTAPCGTGNRSDGGLDPRRSPCAVCGGYPRVPCLRGGLNKSGYPAPQAAANRLFRVRRQCCHREHPQGGHPHPD